MRSFILLGVLGSAVGLGLLGAIIFGSSGIRFGAALGLIGLLVAVQIVFLFMRPTDRTIFGKARRAFAMGNYPAAVQLLEPFASQRPTVRTLTLLGNTYRQMGRYPLAREQLERALALAPRNANVLYGLGRVFLAQGDFEAAADWFDQALAAGAPAAIACDLGLAEYCAGRPDAALRTLQKAMRALQIEPHRLWLANALLCVLLNDLTPDPSPFHREGRLASSTPVRYKVERGQGSEVLRANLSRSAAGRAYWEAEAKRHSATPYGVALRSALATFDQILPSKEA